MFFVLAVCALSAAAYADATDDALRFFDHGKQLFDVGQYEAAREAFIKSRDLAPDKPNPHRWTGLVDEKLGKCDEALHEFDIFLSMVGTTDPRSKDVIEARARCQASVEQTANAELERQHALAAEQARQAHQTQEQQERARKEAEERERRQAEQNERIKAEEAARAAKQKAVDDAVDHAIAGYDIRVCVRSEATLVTAATWDYCDRKGKTLTEYSFAQSYKRETQSSALNWVLENEKPKWLGYAITGAIFGAGLITAIASFASFDRCKTNTNQYDDQCLGPAIGAGSFGASLAALSLVVGMPVVAGVNRSRAHKRLLTEDRARQYVAEYHAAIVAKAKKLVESRSTAGFYPAFNRPSVAPSASVAPTISGILVRF